MTEFVFQALLWLACIGGIGFLQYAIRVWREDEGFRRG